MATITGPRNPQVEPANVRIKDAQTSSGNLDPVLVEQKFDLGIALALAKWTALSIAVQNQWGGPDSHDKRDWLAGAVSELFTARPGTIQEDVEDMLLQVLAEEFDCQLEDDSEMVVAAEIIGLRKMTLDGDFSAVDKLYQNWLTKNRKGEPMVQVHAANEDEEEVSSSDEEMDGGVDVEMEDVPQLVPTRERPEPEIDEDGFTKVVSKKKR